VYAPTAEQISLSTGPIDGRSCGCDDDRTNCRKARLGGEMAATPDGTSRFAAALAWMAAPMGTAVITLGIGQIICWGTTLYALGVLGTPIVNETGWSRTLVFGGLTAGLLTSGLVSTYIGRLIDRRGGRMVMTVGSLFSALGLGLLAFVRDEASYLACWVLLGIAMRMTLYDAAFAAAVQVTPSRGRRAISYITLFGGLASTAFWPIGHALDAAYGWRTTLLVFAAINLFVCVPLYLFGLARREPKTPPSTSTTSASSGATSAIPLDRRQKIIAMALFATVMSSNAFVFGALAVHLPGMLQATGLTAAAAVSLAALKGFAQVAGRLWELLFAQKMPPTDVGRIAVALLPVSFVILLVSNGSFALALAFTLVLGVSNGLVTIVRGAVPLYLFGPEGYGTILGILATPYLILNALSPAVFAAIVDWAGYAAGELVLLAAAVTGIVAMEAMAWWYARERAKMAAAPSG
jgi:MFS family permease